MSLNNREMLAKWSVSDYHRMIEAGILATRRVELVTGEIVEMTPESPLHRFINVTVADYLRQLLSEKARVYEAHPITLPDSEPEPDIAIVKSPDTRYRSRHPYPEDIYWLIEIANSTLSKDLDSKMKAYARAKVPEYWVINVPDRKLQVFRYPQEESYLNQIEYTQGMISPVAFSELQIPITKIIVQ